MYFYHGDNGEEDPGKDLKEDMDLFGFGPPKEQPPAPPQSYQSPQPYQPYQPFAPYPPGGNYPPPAREAKSNRGLKILCIVLTALVVVSNLVTIFVTYYLTVNRPKLTTNDVDQLGMVVAANNINSVALVSTTGYDPDTLQRGTSAGSGFVVYSTSAKAYVMTNYHVVSYALTVSGSRVTQHGSISMTIANQGYSGAKVLSVDVTHDIALVELPIGLVALPAVQFYTGELHYGEFALAIGNPYGQGLSVSQGCVSVPELTLTLGAGSATTRVVQTDAAINPGNSGGPLFNKDSLVIGMNAAKLKKQSASEEVEPAGIGYAISSPVLTDFINSVPNLPFRVGADGIAA